MKFIKLKLKNFKPYYDKQDTHQEIFLFDEERKDKNITLNIGPTGHGKTSISEAILWCIFGDIYYKDWENFVNTLSVEIIKQKKENEVNMCAELILELEGEHYRVIRSGSYDIRNGQKMGESKLSILHNGEPINDSIGFIGDHFPTVTLMKYFVFDADDILKKFEENREGSIKDHINKIVGVEKLNEMINSLEEVMKLYDKDSREIESGIHGDIANKIKTKEEDKAKKEDAIKQLERGILELISEKKNLFKASPSPEVIKFSELVNKRDDLEKMTIDLNKRFKESNIISDMDLLLLYVVIDDAIKKLNQRPTTKEEFNFSSTVIKSSLGENYSGILFGKKEDTNLIKKGARIWDEDLDDLEKLDLGSGEGIKTHVIETFRYYEEQANKQRDNFGKYKKDFDKTMKELMKVRNEIRQIGDTTKNKELKDKYEKFRKFEKQIKEKVNLQEEIKEKIEEEIEKDIKDLRDELKRDEEQKREIKQIEEKRKETQILLNISKKTREEFLDDLLASVNRTASESLRSTVKDTDRFHSIEIDSNYKFRVKQKNGEALEERQINKGNLQISMMSFFFGLSKYLRKKIPYVIDDPLLRLDPGHDKRLIEQLSKTNDQLIFHMIPGKEYTTDSFNWLKPYINIQNWLYREKYKGLEFISYVERKDAEKIVYFDIDKF